MYPLCSMNTFFTSTLFFTSTKKCSETLGKTAYAFFILFYLFPNSKHLYKSKIIPVQFTAVWPSSLSRCCQQLLRIDLNEGNISAGLCIDKVPSFLYPLNGSELYRQVHFPSQKCFLWTIWIWERRRWNGLAWIFLGSIWMCWVSQSDQ